MGIEVSWDNEERTIIRHTYQGEWTWDETRAAIKTAEAMLGEVSHRVDVIVDMKAASRLPANPTSIFREAVSFVQHPDVGMIVMISNSLLIQTFANILATVYPKAGEKIVLVSSEEEAYARLADHRRAGQS
jgi:hypothetical protein